MSNQPIDLSGELPEHSENSVGGVLNILLVEDQWTDQRLISKILKTSGCRVTVSRTLQEAGSLLNTTEIDIILLDSAIYTKNGYDFSAVVEETERKAGKTIPVIGLADSLIKTQRDQSMANGMDEFLPKPVSASELCRVVAKLAGTIRHFGPDMMDGQEAAAG